MSQNGDMAVVQKLEKRLTDLSQHSNQESKIMKILNHLSQINMTVDILQVTHIGKTVNGLRKKGGEMGDKSKQLIKQWKKLIPSDRQDSAHQHKTPTSAQKVSKVPLLRDVDAFSHASPSEPTDAACTSKRMSRDHHPETPHFKVAKTTPKNSHLDVPFNGRVSPGSSSLKTHGSPSRTLTVDASRSPDYRHGYITSSGQVSHDASVSPGDRKRKAAEIEASENHTISVKRSRTQVYSGKSSGYKFVSSLFDMCMKILIENIDAIEEVGGVPFFILEPVLAKCTPTQLMRLEEFNPHFLEDSDELWMKHCQKEFKIAKPASGQSWRDLYIEKVEARERKMKSLTSSIKARQQAREEPVRKAAILSNLAPPPTRKRKVWGGYNKTKPDEESGGALFKKTMKMAKQRHVMMRHRK